jgi:Xaa-Pro aminopeptidase
MKTQAMNLRHLRREEFAHRRQRLLEHMDEDGIAILPTAPTRTRNRDVDYPYRTDSDFFYLTGFAEPDAVLVLIPGRKKGETLLFCRPRDPEKELWSGRRTGLKGARKHYGADQALPIDRLDETLPKLMRDKRRVYYTLGRAPEFDQRVMAALNRVRALARTGVRAPREFFDLDHPIHEQRLIKSSAEIETMREAARISARAHRRAMLACRPGIGEYRLEAEFLHQFAQAGSRSPAYPSIVGSGANACILHYTDNTVTLRDGDLVLIDAGAEVDHYAADITRTFPVNGRFSEPQRLVYELVLEAQKAAIDQVRAGNSWNRPHRTAVRVLTEGLVRLGLLDGKPDKLIKKKHYRKFYMHRTGHWLGMDVHDVGEYKVDGRWRRLEPGMVLTVEPGLYIPAGNKKVPKQFWDIGVRIEDDVLVTADTPEVLSADAPKEIADIEHLMSRRQGRH